MSEEKKIICDGCSGEIEPGDGMPNYHLIVTAVSRQKPGNFSYAMLTYSPIPHTMDFHDMECLLNRFRKEVK